MSSKGSDVHDEIRHHSKLSYNEKLRFRPTANYSFFYFKKLEL